MAKTTFRYQAMDKSGRAQVGFATVESAQALERTLAAKGLTLTDVQVVTEGARALRGAKVKPKHLITFTLHFVALFSAGVPLLTALDDLAKGTESPTMKAVIAEITEQVRGGTALSRALAQFPKIFPETYVTLVEAGEAAGRLDSVMTRIAEYLEWTEETKGAVQSAMIYPIILMGAVFGLVIMILVVLIPRLRLIFDGAGFALPVPTQIVLWVSDTLTLQWPLCILTAVVLVMSFMGIASTKKGRWTIHFLQLTLPVLGPLVRKVCAARFTSTLSNLLSSGVDMVHALEITARVAGNQLFEDAIVDANERVRRGEALGDALDKSKVFQPLVISMIHAGERTGTMDTTLATVNRFYDKEIPASVKRLLAMMEPCIIVVAGGIVGFIIAAAMMPIFKLAQAMKN